MCCSWSPGQEVKQAVAALRTEVIVIGVMPNFISLVQRPFFGFYSLVAFVVGFAP